MPPTISTGSTSAGKASNAALPRMPQVARSPRSPMPRRMQMIWTAIESVSAMSRPGTIVATNRAPTDTTASEP